MKKNNELKRKAYLITLILMAVYFSLIENLIPKPVPWIKMGLSNIITLIALYSFGIKFAYKVLIFRILIYGISMGTLFSPNFLISFSSGLISMSIMALLYKFKKYFSIVGISMTGGFFHNLTQLIIVYFLFFRNIKIFQKSIILFVFIFLLIGAVSGIIIGIIARKYKIDGGI